jgi:quinol-cytochrome oxidoreductase complex cytochrome b subunit
MAFKLVCLIVFIGAIIFSNYKPEHPKSKIFLNIQAPFWTLFGITIINILISKKKLSWWHFIERLDEVSFLQFLFIYAFVNMIKKESPESKTD